jgi:hypothetical protein
VNPASRISPRICVTALRWDTAAVLGRPRPASPRRCPSRPRRGRHCADNRRGRERNTCPLGCAASNSGSGSVMARRRRRRATRPRPRRPAVPNGPRRR